MSETSSVPTSFSWDFEHGFHVDNLDQYLGVDVYNPEDADRLVLQFQKFADELSKLISEVETGKDAEILMGLYNRLMKANNHVLQFVSTEEIKTGLHMNEMKLPDQLAIIRRAFSDVIGQNGDRSPSRSGILAILQAKVPPATA
ncbi:hypothetical protein H6768_05220 [Candidatus Peribacteria bacterium]|nr:hypothetical protein [Candidatus Peribacteria bacterium]